MGIARHGAGPTAGIRALGSQVHPVFMLPPLAASVFGALLAATTRLGATDAALAPVALGVHLVAVFFGLYTAHLKDGYVDFHRRNEDEDHPLTARGCRLALAGSTAGFAVALAAVVTVAGPFAGLLTLPGWVIGYLHAPEFDTNPVTVTAGYPSGVALALLGGFYVQAGTLSPAVVAFAGVFLVSLCGVKIIDDATDVRYDRSIGKRTVAVLYPLAYLWDWYTLEVGVFAIPLRTGVELLGIPLEEHLFMLVVPAFAIGVHELLNGGTGEAPTGD